MFIFFFFFFFFLFAFELTPDQPKRVTVIDPQYLRLVVEENALRPEEGSVTLVSSTHNDADTHMMLAASAAAEATPSLVLPLLLLPALQLLLRTWPAAVALPELAQLVPGGGAGDLVATLVEFGVVSKLD